jgi:hypothetical protein
LSCVDHLPNPLHADT